MTDAHTLRRMIDEARRVVVFTGAGISTESGIPDFRSPGGYWTKNKPIQFQDYLASPEIRLAMMLALHTGQRQVDLLMLPWSAWDGTAVTVGVKTALGNFRKRMNIVEKYL